VDEARKQIQDHMDANLVARQAGKLPDYKRSGGSGPYLKRFKGKPEDLDHVSLAGGLDLEDANEIGAHFFEMQRACDALGIPRLRGLQTMAQVPGAIADMGDGVLRLSTNTLKQRLQAMRLGGSAEANTWAEAGRWKDRRLKQSAKNLREAEKEVKKAKELLASYGPSDVKVRDFYQKRVDALEDWRRQLVEHHAEVEKDVANHLATKPVAGSKAPKKDPWAKGMPTVKRPFTCEAYGYQATNWHEFGHHVHQQHDVQDEVDWMGFKAMNQGKSFQMGTDLKPRKNRTLYEQAVNEAFTASSGPGADWPGTATNYGAYNSMEWFAENFSTAMMGREDLVDPGVKPFIMFHVDKLKAAGLPKMKGA
jgi:hypothetical protein